MKHAFEYLRSWYVLGVESGVFFRLLYVVVEINNSLTYLRYTVVALSRALNDVCPE